MGNDGGSIPKRRELVKNAARAPTVSELKATALESLAHAWAHCALSGEPLDIDTVVSDWRGRLYNYEAILKGLMPSDDPNDVTPSSLGIKSLRDVAKLKVSKNGSKWVCPISMKELGPAVKAVYLVPCGHVFADVAMKEIQEKACPECGVEFSEDNIITILATTETDIERLEKRMEKLKGQGLTHTLKKDKSEKKKKRKGDDVKEEEAKAASKENGKSGKKEDSRISGINNSFAASLTAKVLAEQDERNKRRKLVAEAARG
ncbi:Replication termination factor 2 [Fusarium keratoplasticum]|uniref:Replication termination factor 2 n=1 Tax=Fusarium keratoplasticum TaxID=1328300 RepID=A0ACC0R4U1_9HYPO|nr:Replication termination factor 2 [Fusarium keratoplasticum]KAI8674480.1 Replication termination factor 2 [Fusarium keratoplasticum]